MDKEQFIQLFRDNYRSLHNYLYYKTGNRSYAEDVAQESFLRLWEMGSSVRLDTVVPLLYSISNNLQKNRLKKQVAELNFINQGIDLLNGENPEYILELKEFDDKIQTALNRLPDHERTVFLMNRIEDITYSDIALRLGLSIKAVEKRMSKAIKKLNEAINYRV